MEPSLAPPSSWVLRTHHESDQHPGLPRTAGFPEMLKPGQSWANWDIGSAYPDKNSCPLVCETQGAEANHLIPASGMFLAFSILPGKIEERKWGCGRDIC